MELADLAESLKILVTVKRIFARKPDHTTRLRIDLVYFRKLIRDGRIARSNLGTFPQMRGNKQDGHKYQGIDQDCKHDQYKKSSLTVPLSCYEHADYEYG